MDGAIQYRMDYLKCPIFIPFNHSFTCRMAEELLHRSYKPVIHEQSWHEIGTYIYMNTTAILKYVLQI